MTFTEKKIDNDDDEKKDDEGGEAADCGTTPRTSRLFIQLDGIGVFWRRSILVKGIIEGELRGVFGGFFGFALSGSCSAEAKPAEDVELLPGDETLGVAYAFAEADIDTDAGATDVEGFALGADGEADATFADVGLEPGQDGDAFVETNWHEEGGKW